MTGTTAVSTNPFDDPATTLVPIRDEEEQEDDLEKPKSESPSILETSTNPFDDPALLLPAAPTDSATTSEETTDATTDLDIEEPPSPEAQENNPDNKNDKPYINPFDEEDPTHGTDQQQSPQPEKGSLLPMGDDNRDRYEHSDEEDSVKSMLEMMENKEDYRNSQKPRHKSLRHKARDSLTKTWRSTAWRWTSIGGGGIDDLSDDASDDMFFDDDESYDCIALSALKSAGIDVESLRSDRHRKLVSAPDEGGDDDDLSKSSDGTQTTKNTHGTISNRSQSRSVLAPRRKKYVFLVGSFLALVLFLGILVLSYSLYALRHEDTEELSIFTREFWKNDVLDTLLFWKKQEDDGHGVVVDSDGLDNGPLH